MISGGGKDEKSIICTYGSDTAGRSGCCLRRPCSSPISGPVSSTGPITCTISSTIPGPIPSARSFPITATASTGNED